MSWQDYVDQLMGSEFISMACIAGLDGEILAKSDGFEVSKEELGMLAQGFDRPDILTNIGVTLAGKRYTYSSGTDSEIRAKDGKTGVHCIKTTQSVIITIYEDPVQPQQAAAVVGKLGDLFISMGY